MECTILVIEDEPDAREWLVESLTAEGCDVVCASNGAEGLRRLGALEVAPQLILLDMMMPVMSGWDFLAAVERIQPHPPVVVVTAAHNVDGIPAGAEAVLTKPLHVVDLLATVRLFAAALGEPRVSRAGFSAESARVGGVRRSGCSPRR